MKASSGNEDSSSLEMVGQTPASENDADPLSALQNDLNNLKGRIQVMDTNQESIEDKCNECIDNLEAQ